MTVPLHLQNLADAASGRTYRTVAGLRVTRSLKLNLSRVERLAEVGYLHSISSLQIDCQLPGTVLDLLFRLCPQLDTLIVNKGISGDTPLSPPSLALQSLSLGSKAGGAWLPEILRNTMAITLDWPGTNLLNTVRDHAEKLREFTTTNSVCGDSLKSLLHRHGHQLYSLSVHTMGPIPALDSLPWDELVMLRTLSLRVPDLRLSLESTDLLNLEQLEFSGATPANLQMTLDGLTSLSLPNCALESIEIAKLSVQCRSLSQLSISCRASTETRMLEELISSCSSSLTDLNLENASLSTNSLAKLANANMLQKLQLTQIDAPEQQLMQMVSSLTELRHLELVGGTATECTPDQLSDNLLSLSLARAWARPSWIARILNVAPKGLERLNLAKCNLKELPLLATRFPSLQELDLYELKNLDVRILDGIESSITRLLISGTNSRGEDEEQVFSKSISTWVAERNWPKLIHIDGRPLLRFDDLVSWLAERNAPLLDELSCVIDDEESLFQHLESTAAQRIGRLHVGSFNRQRLAARKFDSWPVPGAF